jgi:predicted DNA-binding protein (MmcQ/YjbR family)
MEDPVETLRRMCMAFPEAAEKPFAGHDPPAWRIRDKMFAMVATGDGRVSVWFKGAPGAQDVLVGGDPERFFVPPYVGSKGWIGVRLDVDGVDWDLVEELVDESYRMIAPKRLAQTIDRANSERDLGKGGGG